MQKIVCPKCEEIIEEIEKTSNKQADTKKARRVCDRCKKANKMAMIERNKSTKMRLKNSERMKNSNPMHNASTRAKMASTLTGIDKDVKDYQTLKKDTPRMSMTELSNRMKLNNPMHNPDNVTKMKATMKQNIESGIIVYKKGNEHHLWKGNRDFNNTCRAQLYPIWTKKVLERDNFTCTMCGTKEDLQVHHIRPLRDILKEVQEKNKIKSFSEITSNKWQPLIDEVIKKHDIKEGITVCASCHAIIDDKYKGK